MTWHLTVMALRGRSWPLPPALPGRVHICADEPLPAEMLAEITNPNEYALCAGISRETARRLLAETQTPTPAGAAADGGSTHRADGAIPS